MPGADTGRLGVGVVGYGYWGPNLARNFDSSPNTAVAGVADLNLTRLEAAAVRFPGARLSTRAEDLFADDAIDAVAIVTPGSSHFDLAHAALAAGKHVLAAKPLTTTTAEARLLIDLAADVNRVLLVDHTFVYAGPVRAIRALIRDGGLGEPRYLDSVRANRGGFQSDVNVIWDLAAHDFAILFHLFDTEPVTISAVGASHSAAALEDIAYVSLGFGGGFIAHFHLSWVSPVKIRRTVIGGSERTLVWDDLGDGGVKVFDGVPQPQDGGGPAVTGCAGEVLVADPLRREALAHEVEHFAECIRTGGRPLTDGESGFQVVRLLEATTASLEAGGQAIALADPVRG